MRERMWRPASGGGTGKSMQGVDPARVQVQNLTCFGDLQNGPDVPFCACNAQLSSGLFDLARAHDKRSDSAAIEMTYA